MMINAAARTSGTGGPSAEVGGTPSAVRAAGPAVASGDTLTTRAAAADYICAGCGAARAGPRIPPGWKRDDELAVCGTCFRQRYALRAVSLPVWQPDAELWADLRAGWELATRTANRLVRELYLTDDWGAADATKLPKYPGTPALAKHVYDLMRAYAPDYTTVSASALLHWVRNTYLRRRFDLWRGAMSLPTYRDVPWIVRKTGWTPAADGARVTITCCVARRTLDLTPVAEFAGQRQLLARAAAGELLRGDAKLCLQGKRLMFRAAVWVPVAAARPGANGTLRVATAPTALLTFSLGDRRAMKPVHLRHLRGQVAAHDNWRQAMADDTKFEKRWPSHKRRDMLAALARRCDRMNDRLRTTCQQIAALVVGYAARRNCAAIALDLADRGYLPHFPYAQLRASIVAASELRNIRCVETDDAM